MYLTLVGHLNKIWSVILQRALVGHVIWPLFELGPVYFISVWVDDTKVDNLALDDMWGRGREAWRAMYIDPKDVFYVVYVGLDVV